MYNHSLSKLNDINIFLYISQLWSVIVHISKWSSRFSCQFIQSMIASRLNWQIDFRMINDLVGVYEGAIPLTILLQNSNSMLIAICSRPNSDWMILTKFCTWHHSCVLVSYAKMCYYGKIKNELQDKFPLRLDLWVKNREWNDPLGWGLLNTYPLFRYFLNFSPSSKCWLPVEYHVHIWQVSPQLSCSDTHQIWKWFK